ncbi:prepilin peptidase [Thalassococcus sp. BH17M4-6]|uniref:prepilin peptidase n=1 Tax=Thalassococcus sp. BH17M4-6 TaxID=3413148 RepID=UPI003BDE27D1
MSELSTLSAILVPVVLAVILLAAVFFDLRHLRLPNMLVYALILCFALLAAPFLPLAELGWRLLAACVLLALGLAAFAAGLIGGGDVKFLSALLLFVPSHQLTWFAFVAAVCLLLSIAIVLAARKLRPGYRGAWAGLRDDANRLPMGLSFGMAGLVFWGLL